MNAVYSHAEFSFHGYKAFAQPVFLIINFAVVFCTSVDTALKLDYMCCAGSGKTTTLVRYAQMRPDLKFLLIVFNK